MKIHKIPQNVTTLIFDIDSTLYTNDDYAYEQVDCQVREFARIRKMCAEDARKLVRDFRKDFAEKNKEADAKKKELADAKNDAERW